MVQFGLIDMQFLWRGEAVDLGGAPIRHAAVLEMRHQKSGRALRLRRVGAVHVA